MEGKSFYITVVDKLGNKTRIPRAGLEHYKKVLEEFIQLDKKLGRTDMRRWEIAEILDE